MREVRMGEDHTSHRRISVGDIPHFSSFLCTGSAQI